MQCMEVWGGNQAISSAVAMPGLTAWVFSRPYGAGESTPLPAQSAGGDIHYVTSCATGRITRLVVADVAGHGQTVARASDALRRLMRTYSNYIDQSSFVEQLNRRFAELAEQADDDSVQPGAFATAVVATYFAPTDELAISNAGHPRPMRYVAARKKWESLVARAGDGGLSNLPLGIDTPTEYPTTRLEMGEGDLVLMYSDSFIEMRDQQGRMLGESGLEACLNQLGGERPDGLIERLIEIVSPSGIAAMNDDVTAMLIARNARKPEPSLALGAVATARIVRAAVASLKPGALPATFPQFGLVSLGGSMFSALNRVKRKR
jgi:phosphoserine phosphatase RsbU/P